MTELAHEHLERRLSAILAADIAGYSALMGADEARTVRDLKAHQAVVLPMVGEFVWRPAGSRHVAVAPEGGLMLAIFQIPNKFYERDGRVTDANGQDWERVWGRILNE